MCALNDVRIHGKSAVEDLEDQLALEASADVEDHAPASSEGVTSAAEVAPQALPNGQSGNESSSAEQSKGDAASALASEAAVRDISGGKDEAVATLHGEAADSQAGGSVTSGIPMSPSGTDTALREQPNGRDAGQESNASSPQHSAVRSSSAERPETAAPILDALGASILRLITPPGAGKKRSPYIGTASNLSSLPLPRGPLRVGKGDSEEAQAGTQQLPIQPESDDNATAPDQNTGIPTDGSLLIAPVTVSGQQDNPQGKAGGLPHACSCKFFKWLCMVNNACKESWCVDVWVCKS